MIILYLKIDYYHEQNGMMENECTKMSKKKLFIKFAFRLELL